MPLQQQIVLATDKKISTSSPLSGIQFPAIVIQGTPLYCVWCLQNIHRGKPILQQAETKCDKYSSIGPTSCLAAEDARLCQDTFSIVGMIATSSANTRPVNMCVFHVKNIRTTSSPCYAPRRLQELNKTKATSPKELVTSNAIHR